jgi:predicted MFS family arabinose efflux permease
MGIFTGSIDSGFFLGSILLGYIGNWFGYPELFLVAGTILLLGFGLSRIQPKSGQAAPHGSD